MACKPVANHHWPEVENVALEALLAHARGAVERALALPPPSIQEAIADHPILGLAVHRMQRRLDLASKRQRDVR